MLIPLKFDSFSEQKDSLSFEKNSTTPGPMTLSNIFFDKSCNNLIWHLHEVPIISRPIIEHYCPPSPLVLCISIIWYPNKPSQSWKLWQLGTLVASLVKLLLHCYSYWLMIDCCLQQVPHAKPHTQLVNVVSLLVSSYGKYKIQKRMITKVLSWFLFHLFICKRWVLNLTFQWISNQFYASHFTIVGCQRKISVAKMTKTLKFDS